jgi:IS5 family transposase
VPDYTTLCRRRKTTHVVVPKQKKKTISLILDSTGLKIYGEGEWKVRKHGVGYRRTWRKVHIGIDTDGEIRALSVTHSDVHDCTQVDTILDQVSDDTVTDFYGDGAYDTTPIYMFLDAHDIHTVHIPPRKDAKIRQHGNLKRPPLPRDENLRQIRRTSRKRWKHDSGYHTRSLGETVMYRFKTIFGDTLSTRTEQSHTNDVYLKAKILNTFTYMGMPDGVMVAT